MWIKSEISLDLDKYFSTAGQAGSIVESSASSVDCFLIKWFPRDHYPFIKLMVALIMPVIMFGFFMGFYYVKMKALIVVNVFKLKFLKKKLIVL